MRHLSFFALVTLVASTSLMRSTRAAENQTVHSFERALNRTVGYKYLLALPTGYSPRSEKRWPLMLFLHGSGERGDDVWSVARNGPPKLLRAEKPGLSATLLAENFIVVSPQCPKGEWWDTETLLALLDEIAAKHRVDPRRVYLTGLSMGGFGAWDLGLAHPERFAAMLTVCGGGSFARVYQANTHKRHDLRALAVWAFHGAKDESVPVAESQRMVDMLRSLQAEEVRLTVYPGADHDSWTETYANPEIYHWLLRHARAAPSDAK